MSALLSHVWGVSPGQDRVWAQVCGLAPSEADSKLFMVLQAYIDDSYTKDGYFVLAGYIGTAEKWALFSKEWEELLPLAFLDKNGRRYFKMSEMAVHGRMDLVPAFYRAIEKHVICAISCTIRIPDIERAKSRVWAGSFRVDYGLMDKPHWLALRALMDHFHSERASDRLKLSEWLPLDQVIDFYFDDQQQGKLEMLSFWDDYINRRQDHIKPFYGETPKFENDKKFLPLQAADLWAWWVREAYETNCKDAIIGKLDFGVWKGKVDLPCLDLSLDESDIVKAFMGMMHDSLPDNRPVFDVRLHGIQPDPGMTCVNWLDHLINGLPTVRRPK